MWFFAKKVGHAATIEYHDEQRGGDDGDDGVVTQPTLSHLLALRPAGLEAAFWSSAYMHAASRSSDFWACCMLLPTDLMFLLWMLFKPRHLRLWDRCGLAMLQATSTLVQLAFILVTGTAYSRWRPTSLVVNRAFRMAILLSLAIYCRTTDFLHITATDPLTQDPLLLFPTFNTHPHLSTLCVAVFHSASMLAYINAMFPLPWVWQLATQLLHLVPLTCMYLPVARPLLTRFTPAESLEQLCQTISHTIGSLLSGAFLGGGILASMPFSRQHCQEHAAGVLLLFLQLYIALFLPVYLTYRSEHQHKVAFIRQLRAQQNPTRRRNWREGDMLIAVPGLDIIVLMIVTGLLWVVTILCYDLLPFIQVPLSATMQATV